MLYTYACVDILLYLITTAHIASGGTNSIGADCIVRTPIYRAEGNNIFPTWGTRYCWFADAMGTVHDEIEECWVPAMGGNARIVQLWDATLGRDGRRRNNRWWDGYVGAR